MNHNYFKINYFSALLLLLILSSCMHNPGDNKQQITGAVTESLTDNDSIFFFKGDLNTDYYETNVVSSELNSKKFDLELKITYPHLYFINLKSERNNIPQRGGYYFFDGTTTAIQVDSIGECSWIEGNTHLEYTSKFLPFLFEEYDCKNFDLGKLEFNNGTEFISRLQDYIKENNESYVALWLLIKRINQDGFQPIFKESLQEFSEEMKNEKLWQMANAEVESFRIKTGEKFPELKLQNTELIEDNLKLPEAQFTLIDFWFSSCIPCLKEYPGLKKLYSEYHSKGFNIVGISVDRTNAIEKWNKAILTHQLPWINYLDENGVESTKEKITSFPTTFLLDKEGNVIQKNISTEDLAVFLEKELEL